ncbi:minor capsid protein [Eubacterium ventriosum]
MFMPVDFIKASNKMNVSKANAGRLVMTESAYFSSAAQRECFKELDVERYEIVATLDGHISDICQEMDGKVFKMSKYEEQITAPPFHVNCRSCTAPYFDDEFTKGEQRATRDEDGNTYYVPDDITYKEWKNTLKNDRFYEAEKTSSRIENLQVKWNNVNNPEYKRKFSNITSSEEVNNKLYEKAMDILKHRNGTDYEDFYLIDMRSGEVKASQTKIEYMPNIEEELKHNRVWYNKEIKREIRNNPPKTFITIHNHSHNMTPSGGDFKGAFNNNYYAGINICYNGDIYYYKVGKKKFTEKMYDLTVAKYRNRGYNEIETYEATLNQFVKEYGIKWRKL